MVMSTGIVSITAQLLGMAWIALALFWLNLGAYAVLWALNVLRIALFPRQFFGDMIDHQRGPGFFTFVAASSVLGSQLVLITHHYREAIWLWGLALALWLGLTYAIFAAFTVKQDKPPLEHGINGAWLLAVVATQSISVLSALIAPHWEQPYKLELNFLALSMWLWGGMLYI